MKVFRNNAIYVERKDVEHIKYLPYEVFLEMEKSDYYDKDFYKFVTYKAMEFFKENDVILDYDYITSLDGVGLEAEIKKIENYLFRWERALKTRVGDDYYDNERIVDDDKDFRRKKSDAQYMIGTIENYEDNKDNIDEIFSKIEPEYKKVLKM